MGSHRVGHDWSDLAAAVAAAPELIGQSGKFELELTRVLRDLDTDLGVTYVIVKFTAKSVDAISKE